MGNLIYPRTINVSRTTYVNTGNGLEPSDTSVLVGVPASIQMKRVKPLLNSAAVIPVATSTNPSMSDWIVFFKVAIGSVQKGDKITDDLGQTYEVETPYYTGMGYQCECRIYKP